MSSAILFQFLGVLRRFAWKPDPPRMGSVPARRLSVIIPARDEEADIGESLRSVLGQCGVELELIVVNDHSTDRTGEIADNLAQSDSRLRVLHDPALPPGWLGKCNAMQQAASGATGDYLIFSDADILHQPLCFATALAEMEQKKLDFLSFFPRMDCVSFWENVNLPVMIAGLALIANRGMDDPRSAEAMGVGAFMMVRTAVFHAVGGLESVKGEMLDDVALARLIKKKGYRLGFHGAPGLLEVRLYKDNRHAFWGMTKNILAGLQGRYWLAPAVMLLPVLVFWVPLYCIVAGVLESNLTLVLAGAGTYLFQYAIPWFGRRLFRFHAGKALFFPLIAINTIACMGKALFLYLVHGEVDWRGRSVRVRGGESAV